MSQISAYLTLQTKGKILENTFPILPKKQKQKQETQPNQQKTQPNKTKLTKSILWLRFSFMEHKTR